MSIKSLSFDIHSTFFPQQHIHDPSWFAGRRFDIERALKALCRPGASIIVYGERGVGKSSFVEMIKLIASGNSRLIFRHDLHKTFPPEKFKYKVISVECDGEAVSTSKVLQRLITSPLGIKSIISGRTEKIETTLKEKLGFDVFKIFSFGGEDTEKKIQKEFTEESTIELFSNLILTISKEILTNGEGLLIAIDEFDLIEDNSKFATLIKTLSKNNVKFLISGIAESYEKLLAGHQSVMRNFTEGRIHIKAMDKEEVKDLFDLVTINSNRTLLFNESFVSDVFEKSQGYPYYVQLFGQFSLDAALRIRTENQRSFNINTQHLKLGISSLVEYEPRFDKDYLSIINDNAEKELLLKALARQAPRKISDEQIFSYCRKRGIIQPKNVLASLLAHRPQFLIREKESDFVYFADPLFKTFCNARNVELIKIKDEELSLK
jgi:GTPase SAR1 family protein